jgi:hypothetical protein
MPTALWGLCVDWRLWTYIYLLSLAGLAAILRVDPLSLTTALSTHRLDLLDHAWTQLLDLNLHSTASTCGALLNCSLLTTPTCSINVSSLSYCSKVIP